MFAHVKNMEPQFKKLSDCPENLRESIDWLIQVRYGNGKDGLGELSQALKKLIEEAIEKALESLNKQYPLANAPSSVVSSAASAPSTTKSAVPTTPEKKSFEDIKEEIKKQVDELPDEIKKLQKESPNDDVTKRLSDCHSKLSALETVHKLAEFAESLTKKPGNDNILTHLCDGLQKFLGYDSASKGYDGSGIVYSDLDRLCDGVMGFLYQVLKDVSGKQPYSVGKTELNKVVEMLKKNLSTGREGFSVIATVAERVREYNEEVKTSNDYVKNKINDMQHHVAQFLRDNLNAINENNLTHDSGLSNAVSNAADLVKDCASKCDEFNNSLRVKIEKDSGDGGSRGIYRNDVLVGRTVKYEDREELKDLNSDLRAKINNARDNVSHEAKRLTTLSATQHRNLQETIELINQTCSSLKKCVKDKIGTDVTALMSNVEKRVAEILKVLKEIESKMREYIDDLAKWINHADIDVGKAMKDLKGIIDKSIGWQNQDKITENAKKFKDKATDLYWKFEGAKRSVVDGIEKAKNEKVSELTKWKNAGDAAVGKAKEKCTEISGMVETDGATENKIHGLAQEMSKKAESLREAANSIKTEIGGWVTNALKQVKDMDEALKKDLFKVKDAVNKQVTEIKNKIGELYDVVKNGEVESKKTTEIAEVVSHIRETLKTITGSVSMRSTPTTGLWAFRFQLNEYVKTYKDQLEKTILREWVEEISKNKTINSGIYHYAFNKKNF